MGQKHSKPDQQQETKPDNNKPLLQNASSIDQKQNISQQKQNQQQNQQEKTKNKDQKSPKNKKKNENEQNKKKKSSKNQQGKNNNQQKTKKNKNLGDDLQVEEIRECRLESAASYQEFTDTEEIENKAPVKVERTDSLLMRTYVYNKYLHHPIELVLNEEIQKVTNERTGKTEEHRSLKNPPLRVLDANDKKDRDPQPKDGLFYYMWQRPTIDQNIKKKNKSQKKIRFMVCITVYSEDMESLMATLDGVYANLSSFKKVGICNEDIVVIVLFDGIDKMHDSMSCFFNDFDKNMEVPDTKKLNVRKNQFLKAMALENENPKTDREKQLMKMIESYEKQATELRKKQLNNANQEGDKFYEHEIYPKLCSLLTEFKDEKLQPMADREQYLMTKLDDFSKELHKIVRDKQKRNIEKKKSEIRKNPLNSSYCYQVNYQPAVLKDEDGVIIGADGDQSDQFLKVFFNVKLVNAGKLSSHMWFFRGYCEMFQPDYCALVDCGTIADEKALYKFFEAMEADKSIGGVCGYMGLIIEDIIDAETKQRKDADLYVHYDFITKFFLKFFCVQKAQKFEYSLAHILDKSFESLFGFIQVLPGAFSAYRWDALKKKKNQKNILDEEYLVSVLDTQFQLRDDYNIKKANMFLAEDRILCLEIFTKKNYILKYLPDAQCQTDAVNNFIQLMKQRRRWINGSWFALDYVLSMFSQKIERSHHSVFRAIAFYACISFIKLQQIMQYLVIAFYFIFLNMTASNLLEKYYLEFIGPGASLYMLALFMYGCFVFYLFYFSLLCRRPEQRIYAFTFISTALGLFILLTYVYYIRIMVKLFTGGFLANLPPSLHWFNTLMIILITVNLCAYVVPSIFYPSQAFFDIFMNVKDYIYFSPAYMHTLLIYAFSNVNDLSWGTKGRDAEQNRDAILDKFLSYKITFVGQFLFLNILFIVIFGILTLSVGQVQMAFILFYAILFTTNLGIKAVASILYSLKYRVDLFFAQRYVSKQKEKYQKDSEAMKNYITKSIQDMHNNIEIYQPKASSLSSLAQMRNQSSHSNNELTPKSQFFNKQNTNQLQIQSTNKFPTITLNQPYEDNKMFESAERAESFQVDQQPRVSYAQSFLYASDEQNNQRNVSAIMKDDSRFTTQSNDFLGVSEEELSKVKNPFDYFMSHQKEFQQDNPKNYNIVIQEIQDESAEYSKNQNSFARSEIKSAAQHNVNSNLMNFNFQGSEQKLDKNYPQQQQQDTLNLNNSSNEWNEDLFEKQIKQLQEKNANLLKKNIQ